MQTTTRTQLAFGLFLVGVALGGGAAAPGSAAPGAPAAPTPVTPGTTAAASAQPPARDGWPDTPVGAIARQWVTAFGAGEDSMAACLNRLLPAESLVKRPMSERLTTYRRLHEEFGTLTLFAVGKQSATELTATLVTSDMSKHPFTFTIQAEAPRRLLSVKTTQSGHGPFPGLGWLHH